MVREKVERRHEYRHVVYSEDRWRLLRELRSEALRLMRGLEAAGLKPILHGSVARGDVHPGSDIDIFIPYPVPSYRVELALESAGYRVYYKLVVQATPSMTPKAYIVLDPEERVVVSFPLAKLTRTEYEFYYFGGVVTSADLVRGVRRPGVDKRLVFIEPVEDGHYESPVVGREAVVARRLGISVETVRERVRVLTRRDEKGRTGVFVKLVLPPSENIEEAVRGAAQENPHLRRVLIERGSLIV